MHGSFEACPLSDHDLDHVAGRGDTLCGPLISYPCYIGPSRPTGQGPGGASPSQPLGAGGPCFRLP